MLLGISFFCLLLLFGGLCQDMRLQLLQNPAGAVCNDGSTAGYYIRKGDNNRWILYLQGGGFCYDKISCDLRSKSSPSLMSSKYWGSFRLGTGIMSKNPSINLHWHNFTAVYIPYCSSDSFSGFTLTSDIGYSFMGSMIVDRIVQQLREEGLGTADEVIFSGSSAGAEGLYPNADRISQYFKPGVRYTVLADSGWFLDYDPYKQGDCSELFKCTEQRALQLGVPLWKSRLNDQCNRAKSTSDKWQCMLGYHAFPYLKTPTFIFAYRFDAAGLQHSGIEGIPLSPPELEYAAKAAMNISASFSTATVRGVFSPSCYIHTIEESENWNKILVSGRTYPDIAYTWTQNPQQLYWYVDKCNTPNCNPTCKDLK